MKRLFLITLCISVYLSMCAQTYYYKLSNVVRNGVSSSNVNGGQFITFSDNICYESDKNGYTVGNGQLRHKSNDNGIAIYYGNSYWGSRSIFRFMNNKTELHVEATNGERWVYKRTSPPAGISTSSLIAAQSNGGESIDGSEYYPVSNVVPTPTISTTGGTSDSRRSTTNPGTTKSTPTRHDCPLCHGRGTIVRTSTIATYGKDTQRYCSTCGRSYWASSGHSHVTCSQCHGKGYFETQ